MDKKYIERNEFGLSNFDQMDRVNSDDQIYSMIIHTMIYQGRALLVYQNIIFNDPIDCYKEIVIDGVFEPSTWTLVEIQELYQLRPDYQFWRNFMHQDQAIVEYLLAKRVINLELLKRWLGW